MSNTTTKAKSTIERGFVMFNDEYYPIFFKMVKEQGFEELHFEAPYYWTIVNTKTLTIFGMTEGDTYKEVFNNTQDFYNECERQINYHIEMEHSPASFGEWEGGGLKSRILELVKVDKEVKTILETLTLMYNAGDFMSFGAEEHKKRLVELGMTNIKMIKGTLVIVRSV